MAWATPVLIAALSLVHVVTDQPDLARGQALKKLPRTVRERIVHDDDLPRQGHGRLQDALDTGAIVPASSYTGITTDRVTDTLVLRSGVLLKASYGRCFGSFPRIVSRPVLDGTRLTKGCR